jgi:hypothetical protein
VTRDELNPAGCGICGVGQAPSCPRCLTSEVTGGRPSRAAARSVGVRVQ